jgi:hypothetical protein
MNNTQKRIRNYNRSISRIVPAMQTVRNQATGLDITGDTMLRGTIESPCFFVRLKAGNAPATDHVLAAKTWDAAHSEVELRFAR